MIQHRNLTIFQFQYFLQLSGIHRSTWHCSQFSRRTENRNILLRCLTQILWLWNKPHIRKKKTENRQKPTEPRPTKNGTKRSSQSPVRRQNPRRKPCRNKLVQWIKYVSYFLSSYHQLPCNIIM